MENEFLTQDEIMRLDLVRVPNNDLGGDPYQVVVDPFHAAADWKAAAHAAGFPTRGKVGQVSRNQGESWESFWARAQTRARHFNENHLTTRA